MARFLRLMILGPPGSGKSTIGKKIADTFQLKHVSSGDVLRDHVTQETPIGKQAQEYINTGKLVPNHTMVNLILTELKSISGCGWLLDGFPRTVLQAKALSTQETLNSVIFLDVPFDTIIARVKDRWIHGPSGRVYNLLYNPPKVSGKDDITGEALTQREDDNPETVSKRLESYKTQTAPLLDYYNNLEVLRTFADTQSDVIWPDVKTYIEKNFL